MRSWGIEYLPMLQAIKKAPLAGAFLMACFYFVCRISIFLARGIVSWDAYSARR